MLNVMVIEWKGDVAERVGIGIIRALSLKTALDPGPQWREITLG